MREYGHGGHTVGLAVGIRRVSLHARCELACDGRLKILLKPLPATGENSNLINNIWGPSVGE